MPNGAGQVGVELRVSAPGKMMLVGEYAVLHGSPALVAAVDLRVRMGVAVGAGQHALPPEAAAAWRAAEDVYGRCGDQVGVDVSALRSGAQKLGVGSSAAAAAAAAGWVCAAAGNTLCAAGQAQRILALALAGHRAVAPRGSGADVAASTLGGFVHVVRAPNGALAAERLDVPAEPVFRAVWTGKQVRTSEMLDAVDKMWDTAPARGEACMAALTREAEGFIAAMRSGDLQGLIEQTRAYGAAMSALGQAAEVPIVEATLERIAELARAEGGAAKPSGAGGGDVALAVFPHADAATRFERRCAEAGLPVLDLRFGTEGVRIDTRTRE